MKKTNQTYEQLTQNVHRKVINNICQVIFFPVIFGFKIITQDLPESPHEKKVREDRERYQKALHDPAIQSAARSIAEQKIQEAIHPKEWWWK
ncbi:hypothetical protein [Levilactobacillus yonginensis]